MSAATSTEPEPAVVTDPTQLSSVSAAQTRREALAEARTREEPGPVDSAGGLRRYIYCIIDCPEPTGPQPPNLPHGQPAADNAFAASPSFGPIGIGKGHPEVFVIAHEGIGAVVSRTPSEKFEISRENTLVHQRVMEAVMARRHTVLPVRFDTIAEDKPDGSADAESRIVNHVLEGRMDEFSGLLATMSTRAELGVKGLWTDMKAVFDEIVAGSDKIRALRDRLRASPRLSRSRKRLGHVSILDGKPKLGEMVKNALDARKLDIETELTRTLAGTAVDVVKNKTFGDPMFTNLAVLIEQSRTAELDAKLSAFEAERDGQVKLRYVGPMPPSNFVEVVITWDD